MVESLSSGSAKDPIAGRKSKSLEESKGSHLIMMGGAGMKDDIIDQLWNQQNADALSDGAAGIVGG